jgi:hypothetical protein
MSFHRVIFAALAALFTVGMTSIASADCCGGGWGYAAPVAYAEFTPAVGGCGGCGAPTAAAVYAMPVAPAPIAVNTCCGGSAWGGTSYWGNGGGCCGGWSSNWSAGCCGSSLSWNVGCGNACGYGGGVGYGGGGWGGYGYGGGWTPGRCSTCGVSPIYVVNQGPVFSGPGLMQPYATYSPDAAYAPAADYPYVPGPYGYGPAPVRPPYYGHLGYRPHYAYRAPMYAHPRYYGPPRGYYHRPVGNWRG